MFMWEIPTQVQQGLFLLRRFRASFNYLPSSAYLHQGTESTLVQVMACRPFGTKALPEPMLHHCIRPLGINISGILIKMQKNHLWKRTHMRRECRERFPRHRLRRKPLVSDPGMHHGTCVTHLL